MRKLNLIILSLALIGAFTITSCEKDPEEDPETIVDLAVDNGFNVLAAALTEAGLIDDLEGPGPFTVFAPSDAAFNAAGITATNVGEIDGLESILKYHVISGKIISADLTSGSVTMLSGADAEIDADMLMINDASIVNPFDVEGSNGVIHTIDAVITPPQNLVQTAIGAGYDVLAAGLVAAGLDDDLQGEGPFTVFAPTDAAFNAAGITTDNIADVAGLSEILLYHVVSGQVTSDMLSTGDVETLSGKYVSVDATELTIDDANIVSPIDVSATNGVIHTIDAVIMPSKNIVETAQATADLSTLVDVLTMYPDLVTALSDETGTYTVFAPTNAAFDALLAVIGQTSIEDVPEAVLKSVLQYHVLASEVYSTDLSDGLTAATLNQEDIEVTLSGSEFLISGTGINTADAVTSNGVVHIMDGVLVPPSVLQFVNTIVEPAYFNKSFTTLIAAVTAADPGILTTLLGDGPSGNGMTLFAPTNDAFTAAGITELPAADVLNAVLPYHLVDGVVMSTDLPSTAAAAPAKVTTVGGDFYLSNKGGGVFINGTSKVTATDIDPSEGNGDANGVVHVIDRTLVPPSEDIVAIAIAQGFSKLADALTEAGLVSTLQGDGPFTVFAPTDAAFDALYAGLGVSGPADVDDATLEAILLYHVLGLRVFSTDLEDALLATTLSDGATFTVNFTNDGVTLTDGTNADANVTATDVLGTNGVIHVIDQVILPGSKK
ncbi:MAG: fasciclin domain-containing protein [Bacteroidales bacterium]|nr:fasciclin domain-containing protein [Bacteroidales bacterium]